MPSIVDKKSTTPDVFSAPPATWPAAAPGASLKKCDGDFEDARDVQQPAGLLRSG
jgi:hypothetical protein